MTLRLVLLMSVVLSFTLGSFALLVHFHQVEVMEELGRTVTSVGRHTLRTLEMAGPRVFDAEGVFHGEIDLSTDDSGDDDANDEDGSIVIIVEQPSDGESRKETSRRKVVLGDGAPSLIFITVDENPATEIESLVSLMRPGNSRYDENEAAGASSDGSQSMTIRRSVFVQDAGGPVRDLDDGKRVDEASSTTVIPETFSVLIDQIEAQTQPDKGLVLKIPTSKSALMHVGIEGDVDASQQDPRKVLTREDLLLEVPTKRFDDAFSALRRRSLLLFVIVLVLGTLLSAGVAAQATRPLRQMDAAIAALTTGNLDVRVKESGGGEIARLGRAFNEMARSLRANRKRAIEMTRREKLSALGRLASGVAHDIRNPLHSINLTLQNLEETSRPTTETSRQTFDRSLRIIRDEIRRLDRLVENFLRFARGGRGKKSATKISPILQETICLVEKTAESKAVQISMDEDDAYLFVSGEAESLRSAMLNLVLNSIDSMPDGGKLSLSLRKQMQWARVDVSDTGGGIPHSLQEKIFEFSYSTKDEGSGLGLAMVHQIVVEEHAGRVEVESTVGEGTRISIFLPLIDSSEIEQSEE